MKKFFSLLTLALLTLSAVAQTTVTLDFTSNDWNLPTTNTVDAGTYSNGTYSITLAGSEDAGYRFVENDKYLILGKNGAYLTLPTFDYPVSKIEIVGRSNASGKVTQNIFVGEDAVSTETTGAKGTNTYEIAEANQAAGTVFTLRVTNDNNTQITKINITVEDGSTPEPTVAAPVFTPNGGKFSGSQEVTITCADSPCNIYYSEGTELDWTNHTYYNAPFYVTETKTFTAVAEKGGIMSEPTTVTFTKVDPAPAYTFLPANYDAVENKKFSIEKDGVTFECSQGTITGEQFRIFKSQTATFTAGEGIADIVKIEFTCTANGTAKEGPGCLALNEGQNGLYTYETDGNMGTWTGKAASISFNTNANQVRATKIVFTLDDGTTVYVADPILPEECEFDDEMTITITAEEGATINYALNDGDYTEYTVPFTINETTTVKAYAEYEGIRSNVVTATYTKKEAETEGPIFNLVTDVTTLADGDRIILVNTAEDGTAVAMGAAKTNNFGGVDVVVNGNKVQTEKANIITLKKSGDNWNLKAAEGYLYAASSSANQMKAEETVDENGNANAAISIAANAASIVFQGSNSRNNLRYNPNNGSPIFSCYAETSDLGLVYIYKTTEDVPEPPVTKVAAPVFTPEKNTVFDKNLGLEISINCETEGATIYYSTDGETFDAYNAPFTIFETTTVKAYAKLGELASDTVYAKYNAAVMVYNLEEANALDNKTNFYFQGDAVVTYKNGKNLWIRDEKGSGLIFGNTIASGEFKTGDVLNKGWDAQKYNYGSSDYEKYIPQFQYPNNVKASGVTQTVEPTEYSTITTDNVNEYIVMKNQTLTDMKNDDGLVFYNKFNIEINIEDGKAYDIVGIVTIYHDEPEVYIISATEVSGQTLVGDVDEDGNVNITDVTALIDMLLSDNTKPSGDVNGDGQINITDVTDLIDILLKN